MATDLAFSTRSHGSQQHRVPWGDANADLARRKPGVQIPSPPPPTLQVRASPASSRQRSPYAGAALGPRTALEGCSTSAWERLPKLVDRQSDPSLDWVQPPLHSWRRIVLARGPAPVAHRSAG